MREVVIHGIDFQTKEFDWRSTHLALERYGRGLIDPQTLASVFPYAAIQVNSSSYDLPASLDPVPGLFDSRVVTFAMLKDGSDIIDKIPPPSKLLIIDTHALLMNPMLIRQLGSHKPNSVALGAVYTDLSGNVDTDGDWANQWVNEKIGKMRENSFGIDGTSRVVNDFICKVLFNNNIMLNVEPTKQGLPPQLSIPDQVNIVNLSINNIRIY